MNRLALVAALFLPLGCAAGENDPGLARDNCRLRDCGAAVGGLETGPEEEDTSLPPEDTAPPPRDTAIDTSKPDAPCMVPSGAACSLSPQCGCSSAQKCDVPDFGTGTAACVSQGSRGPNEKCATTTECARGLTCYYDLCMPLCATNGDCVSTSACNDVRYVAGGVEKTVSGMRVCMAQCDPINPSKSCGASTTCLFPSPTTTTCAAAGLSTTATSCASDPFACAPGYVCVGTGDCKRWCRIGFAGDCPGGKACNRLSSAPKIGSIEYGVCAY